MSSERHPAQIDAKGEDKELHKEQRREHWSDRGDEIDRPLRGAGSQFTIVLEQSLSSLNIGTDMHGLQLDPFVPDSRLPLRGNAIVVLLYGGDKSTQSADIAKAKKLRRDLECST
ncbi:MAG: hypothetical protein V6Z86_06860 [Hyphomicrobiales bacterium]